MITVNQPQPEADYNNYIEHLKRNTLCYRCKWGAEPGELTRCGCVKLRGCERYVLPTIATVKGKCPNYEEGKPIAHPQDDDITDLRAWNIIEVVP